MLTFYDTTALERALALPIDAKLRQLLTDRVTHLTALDIDIREFTYFVVVDAGASMEDLADELGWSPLVNPLDGVRFGSPGFQPYHDFLADRGGWFEMIVSAGNDAAYVLLIRDDPALSPDLLALCRRWSSGR